MRRALLRHAFQPLTASGAVLGTGKSVHVALHRAALARYVGVGGGGSSGGAGHDSEVPSRLAQVLDEQVLGRVLPHMPAFDATRPPHVAVGLSGGVDSAVAAWLLKTAGYRVTGVLMRPWDEAEETGGECSFEKDQRDARAVARTLGIPLEEVDFVQEYWHAVFEPFLRGFEGGGATPNPDLACNRHIKFGALLHHCSSVIGADLLATGHYARVAEGGARLLRGIDPEKDQSYFLASVRGEALRRACFPLGGLTKREVRSLAAGPAGLPPAVTQRRSSAGICFIGRKKDFGDFIQEYIHTPGGRGGGGGGEVRLSDSQDDAAKGAGSVEVHNQALGPDEELKKCQEEGGKFVSVEDGRVVGGHRGTARYTSGQRARLGGAPQAWYVVGKDARAGVNRVYIAPGADHPSLFTSAAVVGRCFWVAGEPPGRALSGHGNNGEGGVRALAQTRYGARAVGCTVRFVPHNVSPSVVPSRFCTPPLSAEVETDVEDALMEVIFDDPERAVTPGQALVLYDGDACLGGGVVIYPGPSLHEVAKGGQKVASSILKSISYA